MRLIFIRHGEPDYSIDGLTVKGQKEAQLLSERTKDWNVSKFYCSPLGRARATAAPTLERFRAEADVQDWLQEFSYRIEDPVTGQVHVPWDLMPEYFTNIPQFYDANTWMHTPLYETNPQIAIKCKEVFDGLDSVLADYGYIRTGGYYLPTGNAADPDEDETTLVFFCHLGVTCLCLSHLLNISPLVLWQGFYLAPSSVTILNCEKRMPGNAWFRIQTMGDVSHLLANKEPVSAMGAFSPVFHH